jgi:hypothetical protein
MKLEHGARLWQDARRAAFEQGYEIPEVAPAVCVALSSVGTFWQEDMPQPPTMVAPWYMGSVGAIDTTAGIVLFEWLVVNPNYSLRIRHEVVERLMRAGMVYAAAIGKRVVMLTAHKGVNAMAKRIGLGVVHPEYSVLIGGSNG